MRHFLLLAFLLSFASLVFAQSTIKDQRQKRIEKILESSNVRALDSIAAGKALAESQRMKAIARARAAGMVLDELGRTPEGFALIDFTLEEGPVFLVDDNAEAAITTGATKLHPGGGLNLSITGGGMYRGALGMWEGDSPLTTHAEFNNLGTTRAIYTDITSTIDDHATHVAGTMIAGGVNSFARGMAFGADLSCFDWFSDDNEMAAQAAAGMLISNHSYGTASGFRFSGGSWYWFGGNDLEDPNFGLYNSQARSWDQIVFNAPYYLPVKSAGNDRGDGPAPGGTYLVNSSGTWVPVTSPIREVDGGTDGYDCISTYGTSKNILTIGAVSEVLNYSGPGSVAMSSFSGWGPTDDGRIKPDLVAMGVGVFSSISTSNGSYASFSGTSMAAPNASGSLILLQEHYENLHGLGQFMRASTLKGLAIHTAREAGPWDGPDYQHGWGLLNVEAAAQLISDADSSAKAYLLEDTLTNGTADTMEVYSNGLAFAATLAWTDLPGTTSFSLNDTTIKLVHNLDLRVIDKNTGQEYFPWVLDPANPNNPATTGRNRRDNIERVNFVPAPGTELLVVVEHSGSISNQIYSLIISGTDTANAPLPKISCLGRDSLFPMVEGFESIISSWFQSTSDDMDWLVNTGATPSTGTGPSSAFEGNNYFYVEASNPNNPSKSAVLESSCIPLKARDTLTLSFAYHMSGATMGSLRLEYSFIDGFWDPLWNTAGDQGISWLEDSVTIIAIADADVKFRWTAITGSSWESDIALDDIVISKTIRFNLPDAPASSSVSICEGDQATLTASGAPLGWNYEWFLDTTTAPIATGSSFTTAALSASSTYYVGLDSAGIETFKTPVFVQVNPFSVFQTTAVICPGETYSFNGQNLTTAGVYRDTSINYLGCDSITELTLAVADTFRTALSASICPGESYFFAGQSLTNPGTYRDTLSSALGCDSILELNLSRGDTFYVTTSATICEGESYSYLGTNYSMPGIYIITELSQTGCDSTIELTLTMNDTSIARFRDTVCSGETYVFQGNSYSASGLYRDTMTNSTGCDSILELDLWVRPAILTTTSESICLGESTSFGGNLISSAGIFRDTLTATSGCDSVVELSVTIDQSTSVSTLDTAIAAGDSLLWNGQWYKASGTYRDTLQGMLTCDSVLELNLTIITSTLSYSGNEINVYPNPAKSVIHINQSSFHAHTISLVGMDGKEHLRLENGLEKFVQLQIADLPKGSYVIQLISNQGVYREIVTLE